MIIFTTIFAVFLSRVVRKEQTSLYLFIQNTIYEKIISRNNSDDHHSFSVRRRVSGKFAKYKTNGNGACRSRFKIGGGKYAL